MADQQFEILIKYGLDKTKATEAVAEMKKVEAASKQSGAEGVKAAESTEKATTKATEATKSWRDAARGLSLQFPVLGRIAAMALNPISLTVTAAIGAFVALKNNVDATVRAFGGLAMPDVSESHVARLSRFADTLKRAGDEAKTGTKHLAENQDAITHQAAVLKALGIDPGIGPAEAAANLASGTATAMMARGQSLMASGANISEADLKKLEEEAIRAETAAGPFGERMERLAFLEKMRGGYGAGEAIEFSRRYGLNTTVDEAFASEQNLVDQASAARGRFITARSRFDQFQRGQQMVGDAQNIFSANVGARRGIEIDAASRVNAAAGNVTGNIATLGSEMTTLFQALMDLQRATQAALREVQTAKRVSDQQQ